MSKNALIGNCDRHNGNWGILVNDDRQELDDMPIISEQRKEFYKIFLNGRYDIILRKSYDRCKN